ncbi:MAG TPA: CusA/CzcA family heavy metal efflux RND transporter, partial [Bacteroidales bacterium]|nr:CusA/CzcA family heavy metal efflux RND transporter [Bacteroidales bacterium]
MFDSIIRFSIDKKLFVGFTIFFLIVAGIYSMMQIPVDAVPDITNNQVQVVTQAPSLAPQEVEKFITFPVEVAMANILDVTEIRSVSRFGLSVVTVVFKDKVPILDARQLVNEQIQVVAAELPEGYGIPQLMPITTGLGEIYQYTLEVDKGYEKMYTPTELRTIQDWIVKRQLSGINGIVEISSFGGYLKQYEVAVDPVKLHNLDLTVSDVYQALADNNQNSGGSYIERYNNAYYIRAEGLLQNLEEIRNIVVKTRQNIPILIKDVATVQFGHAPRFGAMTKNGKGEAVGGITLMLKGANSSAVIKNVKERVARVQKLLPEGVHIKPYLDRSKLVAKTIHTVSKNLLEGGLIVIFVLVLLLGNFRAGLIVASVIPLAMLFAFIMMNVFGVSANLMSLGAIDFGIVVDGAVIIVESIIHHIYSKYKGQELSRQQMNEVVYLSATNIYKSAVFGVIIILIVFLPIITLVGIEGKTFRPMAETVSFVIIGALLLSLTYVPMMSSLILKRKVVAKRTFSDRVIDFLKRTYQPVLKLSLRFKYTVLLMAIVAFVISIWGFTKLGGEFIPTLDEGDLAMQMTLPPGSSLTESMEISSRAEKLLLAKFPEVKEVVSKIGTAEVPTDPMAIEDADIMIILDDQDNWVSASSREELVNKMKKELQVVTGASFDFTQPIQLRFNELMTGAKTDIAVKIYGEDMDELYRQANKASDIIAGIPGAADIKVEQITGLPQLVIDYNRKQIANYGLNIKELNTVIRSAFAGETAGFVFEGEKKFDLVVRFDKKNRSQVNLNRLYVKTPTGQQVPLSQVATLKYVEGPIQISRDDTKRRITIGVNVRNTDVETLVNNIRIALEKNLKLLPGYYITYGGQFENLQHATRRLSIAIPAALALIMLLLFFTFRSIKYALLIFTAVPMSAIGGIAALAIRGMPFSISAGVGFIALFGVAVLNGIVLISYYNDLWEKGDKTLREVVETGALLRLRPVMMTAMVASFGFLPMALSSSAGAEVQKPLATVVIGGLITSTLLTMILLPILYTIVNTPMKIFGSMINNGVKSLLILIMLALPGLKLSAQEDSTRTITLQDAVNNAISKNPQIVNARLREQAARAQRQGVLDLGTTDFIYQKGQLNSPDEDQWWEIRQNFGSLLTHAYRGRYVHRQMNLAGTEKALTEKSTVRDVKSAWFTWLYQYNKVDLYREQVKIYSDLQRIASLHYELGATSLLEKTMSETRYA